MQDYLPYKEKEVFTMLNYAWNEEEARDSLIEYGAELGIQQGIRQEQALHEQQEQQRVLDMLRDKVDAAFIAKYSSFSLERIRQIGIRHGLL